MPKILTIRERSAVRVGDVGHVDAESHKQVTLRDAIFVWSGDDVFLQTDQKFELHPIERGAKSYDILRVAKYRIYEIGIHRRSKARFASILLDGLPYNYIIDFCDLFEKSFEQNMIAAEGTVYLHFGAVQWKLQASPLVGDLADLKREDEMANSVNPHSLGMRLCASNSIDSSHETSGLSGSAEPRSYREAVMKPYRDDLIRSMAVQHPSFPKAQVTQDGAALTDASDYARAVKLDPKTAGKEQVLERIKLLYQERERYARASGLDPQSATDDDIIGRIAMLRSEPDQLRADVVKKLEAETTERQRLQHMVERLLVEKNNYATMIRDLEFSTRRILREIDSKK